MLQEDFYYPFNFYFIPRVQSSLYCSFGDYAEAQLLLTDNQIQLAGRLLIELPARLCLHTSLFRLGLSLVVTVSSSASSRGSTASAVTATVFPSTVPVLPLSITVSQFQSFATPAITVPFPSAYLQTQIPFVYTHTATFAATRIPTTIGGVAATSGISSALYASGTNFGESGNGGGASSKSGWPVWATGVVAGCGAVAIIVVISGIWCWCTRGRRRDRKRVIAAANGGGANGGGGRSRRRNKKRVVLEKHVGGGAALAAAGRHRKTSSQAPLRGEKTTPPSTATPPNGGTYYAGAPGVPEPLAARNSTLRQPNNHNPYPPYPASPPRSQHRNPSMSPDRYRQTSPVGYRQPSPARYLVAGTRPDTPPSSLSQPGSSSSRVNQSGYGTPPHYDTVDDHHDDGHNSSAGVARSVPRWVTPRAGTPNSGRGVQQDEEESRPLWATKGNGAPPVSGLQLLREGAISPAQSMRSGEGHLHPGGGQRGDERSRSRQSTRSGQKERGYLVYNEPSVEGYQDE